jgi:NAD-dependent dihydropyrimidine dehydrogenase PreA subunit
MPKGVYKHRKGRKSPNWKGGVYLSNPQRYQKSYRQSHYTSTYKRDRYRVFKAMWVAYKGGKCEDCGGTFPNCVFQFHHRNPEEKKFTIGSGAHKAYEVVKAEVDKCDLLCANCHFIREYEDD